MATFDTSVVHIRESGLSPEDKGLALAFLGANDRQAIYTLANDPDAAVRLALFRFWAASMRQQQEGQAALLHRLQQDQIETRAELTRLRIENEQQRTENEEQRTENEEQRKVIEELKRPRSAGSDQGDRKKRVSFLEHRLVHLRL
eukprot:TRINITY_DN576_c0_g1_i2.p1 TRINITY_DN576_c0_g1~~TRINITY_DN576_c0_g1_i2.p1  ORF type:complete len:145 (-),score=5.09 TRINITY_DN576_c0_g1_i2:44-478(-)